MIKNEVKLSEVVQEESFVPQSVYNGRYNKSTIFLLYMLGGLDIRNRLMLKYLVNVYLDDKGIEHDYKKPLFLLFKVRNYKEKDWIECCKILKLHPQRKDLYITDYYCAQHEGMHHIMFVFTVPEKWQQDFFHFKMGRYSQFSDEYKAYFPKEVMGISGKAIESKVWGAIHKSQGIQEYVKEEFILDDETISQMKEFWDKPRKEHEYYRYKTE